MPQPRKRIDDSVPGWQRSLTDAELLADLAEWLRSNPKAPFVVGRWWRHLVYVTCPYCFQRHRHSTFSHKRPHCSMSSGVTPDEKQLGYIAVPRRFLGRLERMRAELALGLAVAQGRPMLPGRVEASSRRATGLTRPAVPADKPPAPLRPSGPVPGVSRGLQTGTSRRRSTGRRPRRRL